MHGYRGFPDFDTFAKNDKERKVVHLLRAFQVPRWPHHLAPGTAARVGQDTTRYGENFQRPGLQQDFKKLMGHEPSPLTGEEVEKAVREGMSVMLSYSRRENSPMVARCRRARRV